MRGVGLRYRVDCPTTMNTCLKILLAAVMAGSPLLSHGAAVPVTKRVALGADALLQWDVLSGVFSPLRVNFGDPVSDDMGQAVSDTENIAQYPHSGTWDQLGFESVPAAPLRAVLASKGAPVPGAGVSGSGIPAGAVWARFGVPSINDSGQAVVLGTFKVGFVSTTAIFGWELADMAGTMRVIVKKGDSAPGLGTAVMSAFNDPLLNEAGQIVWMVSLANTPGAPAGIDTTNNAAIFLDPDGARPGAAFVVAQKGTEAADAAVWKAFGSLAFGGNAVMFTATLSGATKGDDSGLWVYNQPTSTLGRALREGDPARGSTIKTITALVARPGSPGQGRGVASDGVDDFTVFRTTLADTRQALGFVPQDNLGGFSRIAGGDAAGYGAGAKWQSFGIPTQAPWSAAVAFLGTVKSGTGTATVANNVAIFAEDDVDYITARIVSKGDTAAGVSGGIFSAFKDPVSASNRSVAFIASLKTAAGVTTANNDGIWFSDDTNGMRLVAREGAQPPEAPLGAQWKAFTSLALPEGRGPLFVATMHSKTGPASPGPGGITTANDVGLWATDSSGELRLLLREGDAIGASTVKTFMVLSSVVGSPAQTRSFNNSGSVIVRVTDLLGAQHLLHIAVP